jgi:hypothetical protein
MAPAVNYSACTAAGFPSRLERRPTAAFQWLRRRGPLCWLRKELGNVDGQRLGEAIEHVDGRVFLLPLQAADVRRFSHTWKSHRRDRTGWLPWRDSNRSASISNRSAGVICKLTSHANISETVRTIFRRYLDLGSMGAVIEDLDQRGIRTNV